MEEEEEKHEKEQLIKFMEESEEVARGSNTDGKARFKRSLAKKREKYRLNECAIKEIIEFEKIIQDTYDSVTRKVDDIVCLLYTSPSPRDRQKSRMPSSA